MTTATAGLNGLRPLLVALLVFAGLVSCAGTTKQAAGPGDGDGDGRSQTPEAPTGETIGSADANVVGIMRVKLGYTHAMLDAIALKDFLQVEASAMSLIDLSHASDWQVHDTASYRVFSERFREAAEDVSARAREEDIDGVSRAYVRLSMSCVDCHSYLRKEGLTKDMPGRYTRNW